MFRLSTTGAMRAAAAARAQPPPITAGRQVAGLRAVAGAPSRCLFAAASGGEDKSTRGMRVAAALLGGATAGAVVQQNLASVQAEGKETGHQFEEAEGCLRLTYSVDGEKWGVDYKYDGTVEGPYPLRGAAKPVAAKPAPTRVAPTTSTAVKEAGAADPFSEAQLLSEAVESLDAIEKALGIRSWGKPAGNPMDGFPYFTPENKSLAKKHLSPAVYQTCQSRITPGGFTLDHAIQSAVDNQDSGIGVYAGDEASYSVFGPLFDAIIEDYHGGYSPSDQHQSDMDAAKLSGSVSDDKVVSTRIRVGRNIRGFGLSPGIKRADRRQVEKIVTTALDNLSGDLQGKYYSLATMSEADRKQLVADHFLFKKGDRFLQSAGANRDWPEARGIFHNKAKTFLVWINEEDQLRIISMQKGGDAKQVFERLSRAIDSIEKELQKAGYEFMHNDHLGYIHSCPTNCGTGMRASVHVKIPNVAKHPDFKKWCAKLRLQPRGIHGEHSESSGGIYDLSNKERLGKSEVELVQTMIDGVNKLTEAEDLLAAGKPVSI